MGSMRFIFFINVVVGWQIPQIALLRLQHVQCTRCTMKRKYKGVSLSYFRKFFDYFYTLSAEFRQFFRHRSRPPATGHRGGHCSRGSSARSGRSSGSSRRCRCRRRLRQLCNIGN